MSWTYLNDTTPRARKKHTCNLCDLPIAIGEIHVARRGVSDGEMITARMHTDCEKLTSGWTQDDWETYDPTEFRDEKEGGK